ncbi:AN1-type zinc finger protein 1 [Halotydeus destructor]|nr:AN1-type zinc finger protein 1 [Halotydeus destructor]
MAPAGKKGVKNNDLAKKVAYMKLKQKAVGMSSIPATERLYFNVSVKELNDVEQPFFFSKEWSFGRCVDYLSTHLKIANRNNVKEAPKLVLCRIADGLQYDLSDKLKTALAQDNIADGDSLSFTHV